MRIVGGSHRGRRLLAPEGGIARPTADRTREALFNILCHASFGVLVGARVVDCFAGSGALGLEALSRGAAHVTFLEKHPAALDTIRTNLAAIREEPRGLILRGDATHPPKALEPCDLALLDAPYDSGLSVACLEGLRDQGWLTPEALVVVEVAAKEAFPLPLGFEVKEERVYGAARLVFLAL